MSANVDRAAQTTTQALCIQWLYVRKCAIHALFKYSWNHVAKPKQNHAVPEPSPA